MLVVVPKAVSLFLALATAVWPLAPRPEVVRAFEPPPSRYAAGHRGVDLLGSPGQRVVAVQAGTVSYAGMLAGRGVVVVDHGTTRTTYEPVRASVARGASVSAGDPLGSLEAGPSHCRPRSCLHLGLRDGDTYLDPLSLLGPRDVRLLPLLSDLPRSPAPAEPPAPAGPPAFVGLSADPWGGPGADSADEATRATAPAPVVSMTAAPWWLRPGDVPADRPSGAGPW